MDTKFFVELPDISGNTNHPMAVVEATVVPEGDTFRILPVAPFYFADQIPQGWLQTDGRGWVETTGPARFIEIAEHRNVICGSEIYPETVVVRTGARVDLSIVKTVYEAIESLRENERTAYGKLVNMALDPEYPNLFTLDTEQALIDHGFLSDDGTLHDLVRAIVLSSIDGQWPVLA